MITTNQLIWDAASKTFSAEMSELRQKFEQIYDDACDAGFRVISSITGKEVRFYITEERHDNDGDLTMWILRPVPEDVRRNRKLEGVSLKIFND